MNARSGALPLLGLLLSACAPAFRVSPTATSAPAVYASPFRVQDLDPHERINCGDHAGVTQGQGKDFRISRWGGGWRWSGRLPGAPTDPGALRNEHFVVYGRPFHAVAAGEVIGCWRNAPENPVVGQKHSALGARLMPTAGNHLWIRHDDGIVVLYAHAIPGSIPAALCPHEGRLFDVPVPLFAGDPNVLPAAWVPAGVDPRQPSTGELRRPRVERGQFLGRVGNSGQSTAPHLHLHMEHPAKPRSTPHMMRFEPFAWTGITAGKANPDRWRTEPEGALPSGELLWWPAHGPPVIERVHLGVAAADFQKLVDDLAPAGFWPFLLDGYSVAGKPYLNSIWRPAPARWRCWSLMSEATYLARRSQALAEGLQLVALDSSLVAGQARYSVVFAAEGPGDWLARHDLDEQQHLALMREAQARKLAPVSSSVIVIDGRRRHTVLYRSGDVGGWRIDNHVPEDALQGLVVEARRAGLQPSAMNGYVEKGRRYLTVVLAEKPISRVDVLTGLSLPGAQAAAGVSKGGLRAQAVTGYDGTPRDHQFAVLMGEPAVAAQPGEEEGGVLP